MTASPVASPRVHNRWDDGAMARRATDEERARKHRPSPPSAGVVGLAVIKVVRRAVIRASTEP